jgi:glycosyltransferase involved in cell wall biosynthesis
MRIAVACKFFAFGGVVAYNMRLAGAIAAAGHDVDLIFLRGAPPIDYPITPAVRVVSYATGLRATVSKMVGMPLIHTRFKDSFSIESSPDVVGWTLTPFWKRWKRDYDGVILSDESYAPFNVLAAGILRMPFAVEIHEGDPNANPPLDRFRRWMLEKARFLVTQTPRLAEVIRSQYNLSSEVMPITMPVTKLTFDRRPIVIVDTRWTKERRPEFLLEIIEREPLAHYVMAGNFASNDLFDWFRAEVSKAGLQSRITYHLWKTDDSVARIYSTAIGYLRWPHRRTGGGVELGVGWGVIRALENGCPCIVDGRLGGAFLIENGKEGFLVNDEPESYAMAISSLLADPTLVARLSVAAWKRAQDWSGPSQLPRVARLVDRFQK